ncbi:MAG: hypothetical protein IBJ10_09950, partial [Phycisphaerales bacterium]|nr:hypothetical protein [Phycisphaerales bacterium]
MTLLGVGVVMVGGLTWVVWPDFTAEPAPHDPQFLDRMNALAAEGQPEGENGWIALRAFLLESGVSRDYGSPATGSAWAGVTGWDAHPSELLHSAWDDPRLTPHREALEAALVLLPPLDAAMDGGRFYIPYRWDGAALSDDPDQMAHGPRIALDYLRVANQLAAINAAAMRRAATMGDWPEATRRLETGLAMAERLSRQAMLIEGMVGVAIEGMILAEMRRLLNEFDIPSEASASMLRTLEARPGPWNETRRVIAGEMEWMRETMRPMFSTGGVFLDWKGDTADMFLFEPRNFGERIADMRHAVTLRWTDFEATLFELAPRVSEALDGVASPERPSDRNRFFIDEFFEQYVESFSGAGGVYRRTAAEAAAVAVMLRLELFHAEHGRWPESLLEAMTAQEAADPVSGRLFEYSMVDDPGRPYSLPYPANAGYM